MPAEYKTLTLADAAEDAEIDTALNDAADHGWIVKAAHSRTAYLLEKMTTPAPVMLRAEPRPPTGPGRDTIDYRR